jgi:hypothetical protein
LGSIEPLSSSTCAQLGATFPSRHPSTDYQRRSGEVPNTPPPSVCSTDSYTTATSSQTAIPTE